MKTKNFEKLKSVFLKYLILLLIILVACQSESTTMTPSGIVQVVETPIETNLPISSIESTTESPLSLNEKEDWVFQLYKSNNGCELPCWWGIVPGETDWVTAKLFLDKVAIIESEAPRSTSKIFTLSEILNIYGRPADVQIDTYGYAHEGPNPSSTKWNPRVRDLWRRIS